MKALASDYSIICRSQDPHKDFLYTPSVLKLPSGRLLMSFDISDRSGEIRASDDGGLTWTRKAERMFHHARLFTDGDTIYLLGHYDDLVVFYSKDEGETWSEGSFLTQGEHWHQSACSVWYKDGYVYLVMEVHHLNEGETFGPYWSPNILAPVVMRGKLGTDLTKRENWLFSNRLRFRDIVRDEDDLDYFGVPFFPTALKNLPNSSCNTRQYREQFDFETSTPPFTFVCQPIGFLETNVVQILDPQHYWYDPAGKTLHLFMRAHTGGSGFCAMLKAVERVRDGKEVIDVECETNPSGRRVLLLPMPGGQMKFYVKYDEVTKLYWLLSTQATDTMRRLEHLPDNRYNIPCDERDRLTLHFSRNMVDWVFAGLVDKGGSSKESRHYASMDIDGDDLIIASRSGDADAHDAHCGNILTFHRVKNFRDLVY